MIIPKRAATLSHFRRQYIPFESAREAMRGFLETISWGPGDSILLPAYIGWSKHEGSGVFDPVAAMKLKPAFYQLDKNLAIDLDDLRLKLSRHRPRVVLIIHYFGFVDPRFRQVVELCRAADAIVLEDAAHAMLTDVIGGRCGRDGAACLYSLHKLLPYGTGGALVLNHQSMEESRRGGPTTVGTATEGPWHYDLLAIAEKRRENATFLMKLIQHADLPVELLHSEIDAGVVPQTLPINIRKADRDKLYETMNAAGYGVTSLYHTLVSVIPRDEFPVALDLSRQIMNLPVHQDLDSVHLRGLVAALKQHLCP